MIAVAILFWTCLAMVAWSYVGYGIFLAVVARFRSRPVAAEPCEPSVSVVIAAYNEEKAIASKIENLLALHSEVADVAVIGLPDEERGERCCRPTESLSLHRCFHRHRAPGHYSPVSKPQRCGDRCALRFARPVRAVYCWW